MALSAERKEELVSEYQINETDTGSPEVQVALLTKNIEEIQLHLKVHAGDKHTRRGLQNMVARRRKMLDYLKSKDLNRYTQLISKLGIRR